MNKYLVHHGILGMKWGIRRYQNKDGSLTDAGRKRYDVDEGEKVKKDRFMIKIRSTRKSNNYSQNDARDRVLDLSDDDLKKAISRLELEKKYRELTTEKVEDGHQKYMRFMEKIKTGANTGVAVAGFVKAFRALKGESDSDNGITSKLDKIQDSIGGLSSAIKKEAGIKDNSSKKEAKKDSDSKKEAKKDSGSKKETKKESRKGKIITIGGDHTIRPAKGLYSKVQGLNRRISAMHSDEGGKWLAHYGVKGQRYGVRRFQNEDGSYTAAGKARYGISQGNAQSVASLNTQNQYWRNRPGESGKGKTIYVSPTPDDYMMPVNERKYGRSMHLYTKKANGKSKLTGDHINAKEVFRGRGNSQAARPIDARNSAPVGNNDKPNPLKNGTSAQSLNKPFNRDFNRAKKKYVNSELESARKDLLDAAAKRFGVNSPQYAALLEGSGGKNYTRDIGIGAVEAISNVAKPHDSELTFDKNSEYDDKIVRKEYSDSKVTRQEDDAIARARDAVALDDYGQSIRKQTRASQNARSKGKSKTAVSVRSSKADLRSAAKELLKNRKNSKQTK